MTITELLELVERDPPFEVCPGLPPLPSPDDSDRWFCKLIRRLRPWMTVELGTGDGYTAAHIAASLNSSAYFTTINWPNPPSGDEPLRYLLPYIGRSKVSLVYGDTREEAWRFVDESIDLLYIDSTHTYNCATAEWIAYRPKLADYAVVIVDDLDRNDMMRFWGSLHYSDKVIIRDGRMGVFRYRRCEDRETI